MVFFPKSAGGDDIVFTPHPPFKPPVGTSTIQGSPGLLTSTGGLLGVAPLLLVPTFDFQLQRNYLGVINPNDFNCEEDAAYFFREEEVQLERVVSIHKIILTYREIGAADFIVGVTVYNWQDDSYNTKTINVSIAPPILKDSKDRKILRRRNVFPDNKIHTKRLSLVISGQRPQLFITRKAESGPLSIVRATIIGKADEMDIL